MPDPLLHIDRLHLAFDTPGGDVHPVRDSSIAVHRGQTVALVGESGCGKSVTAMTVLRLIPVPPGKVLGGRVVFEGTDLLTLTEKQMRKVRGGRIAMIFQEPMTSLNPVYTIGDQIAEAVSLHQGLGSRAALDKAEEAMRDVGISDPRRRLGEYPHQMSGGMRQRVMIAMALACEPDLLIADEPTTALDVTIQAQILELLRSLQRERDMAILLITHDLGVVAENADVVAVMYASRIVETATVEDLFDAPQHPYTRALFRSIPKLNDRAERLETIPGNVPNPADFPSGCKFHTRCPLTVELASKDGADAADVLTRDGDRLRVLRRCVADEPDAREVRPGHWAACHQIAGYDDAAATTPVLDHRRETQPDLIDPNDADRGRRARRDRC